MSRNLYSRFILSATLVMFWATTSHAEWFIKYEFVPELGYIQIRSLDVEGEEYIDHMLEQREDYAEKGIYFGHGEDAPKVYLHTDALAGHTIKTRIMVYAPAMVGYGGANWTATVNIKVDLEKLG